MSDIRHLEAVVPGSGHKRDAAFIATWSLSEAPVGLRHVQTEVFLTVGKLRAKVQTAAGIDHDFKLLSSVAVASVRGTDFDFDGSTINCYEGTVVLENKIRQKRSVRPGEEVSTEAYTPPESAEEAEKAKTDVSTSPAPAKSGSADGVESLVETAQEQAQEQPSSASVITGISWPE